LNAYCRISAEVAEQGRMAVTLAGVPGERVVFLAPDTHAGRLLATVSSTIENDGMAGTILSRPGD